MARHSIASASGNPKLRLTFLGTRGEIEARSARHRRHSALLIQSKKSRIIIDCGANWLGRLPRLRPSALLVTHAHRDHAGGLAAGAPCPVYTTAETWALIGRYPIVDRRVMGVGRMFKIGDIECTAFSVQHSTRAPAVGFRIAVGPTALFYVPDLVAIDDRRGALRGVTLYIGDGATLTRPLVRRRGKARIGHTPVRAQLGWCQQEGVAHAIFTHCGSEIVTADGRTVAAQMRRLGREHGVEARIAYDGLRISLPLGAPAKAASASRKS